MASVGYYSQTMVPYRAVFEELEKRGIRYLIAGGFAVNFHQVQRATVDLDLIISFEQSNALKFVGLMNDLGFRPKVPVPASDFVSSEKREEWIQKKGMMVFSFHHPDTPFEVIDVFVKEPMPFEQMWERKKEIRAFGLTLKVVAKQDLIRMKQNTGRDKDEFDIQQLKKTDS